MKPPRPALRRPRTSSDLTTAEICSIANFNIAALIDRRLQLRTPAPKEAGRGRAAAGAAHEEARKTAVKYDVVEKTIGQLRADMEAGVTTSQEITRAYLDRIEYYDKGQFGFHAYEIVAADAMAQAKAADAARKSGATGPLLGIPIAVKNNYDTFDMATTNGSFTFEGFRAGAGRLPGREAARGGRRHHRQGGAGGVRHERPLLQRRVGTGMERVQPVEVRARIERRLGQRRGGSLAAAALGSQTGDSLYAPASAQSLVTLRGTDGLRERHRHHAAGLDDRLRRRHDALGLRPGRHAQRRRGDRSGGSGNAAPADWRRPGGLALGAGRQCAAGQADWLHHPLGDVLGRLRSAPPARSTRRRRRSKFLEAAGATIVEMGVTVPAPPTGRAAGAAGAGFRAAVSRSEGWRQYIDSHPELVDAGLPDLHGGRRELLAEESPATCGPQPSTCAGDAAAPVDGRRDPGAPRLPADHPAGRREDSGWTRGRRRSGVDAVVYPGLLSDISLNDGGGGTGGASVAATRRAPPTAFRPSSFPPGYNDHGQPINIQLLGRAWDDAKLVGLAYAFEHYASRRGGHRCSDGAGVDARQSEGVSHHLSRSPAPRRRDRPPPGDAWAAVPCTSTIARSTRMGRSGNR